MASHNKEKLNLRKYNLKEVQQLNITNKMKPKEYAHINTISNLNNANNMNQNILNPSMNSKVINPINSILKSQKLNQTSNISMMSNMPLLTNPNTNNFESDYSPSNLKKSNYHKKTNTMSNIGYISNNTIMKDNSNIFYSTSALLEQIDYLTKENEYLKTQYQLLEKGIDYFFNSFKQKIFEKEVLMKGSNIPQSQIANISITINDSTMKNNDISNDNNRNKKEVNTQITLPSLTDYLLKHYETMDLLINDISDINSLFSKEILETKIQLEHYLSEKFNAKNIVDIENNIINSNYILKTYPNYSNSISSKPIHKFYSTINNYSSDLLINKLNYYFSEIVNIFGDKWSEDIKSRIKAVEEYTKKGFRIEHCDKLEFVDFKNKEKEGEDLDGINIYNKLNSSNLMSNYSEKHYQNNNHRSFNADGHIAKHKERNYCNDINVVTDFIIDKVIENNQLLEFDTKYEDQIINEIKSINNKLKYNNENFPLSSKSSNVSFPA